jgi:hypothetical protein
MTFDLAYAVYRTVCVTALASRRGGALHKFWTNPQRSMINRAALELPRHASVMEYMAERKTSAMARASDLACTAAQAPARAADTVARASAYLSAAAPDAFLRRDAAASP